MATTNAERPDLLPAPHAARSAAGHADAHDHPAAATRLSTISGEGALDVLSRARVLESEGRNIAQLAIGEPQFPVAPHIVDAAITALQEGDARYGPPAGLPELRAAVAEALGDRRIAASPEDVIITPGAKPMLLYAFLATVEPGAEVLVPNPGFPIYPSLSRFTGGVPVSYGLDAGRGFAPNVDDIAARITARTRVLVLNAPHNPTGGTIDSAALEQVAELVLRHNLIVISDEIYGRIVYDTATTPSIAALPGLRDRTIVVDGFSKTYAMTGWRLGFGLVPRWLAGPLTTLVVNGHTCTPPFVQRAGVAALTGPQHAVDAMVAELRSRRDAVVAALRAIPGVRCATPAGAFYAFPDVTDVLAAAGLSARQLADRLLEEHGVALLPGTGFGSDGAANLRISFAGTAQAVRDGLDRLAAGIAAVTA